MSIEWIVCGLLVLVLAMAICWLGLRLDRHDLLLEKHWLKLLDCAAGIDRCANADHVNELFASTMAAVEALRVRVEVMVGDWAAIKALRGRVDALVGDRAAIGREVDDLRLLVTKSCRLCGEETDRLQMAVAALEASVEQIQLDGKNARQNVVAAQDMARRALTGVTRLKGALGNLASVADQLSDEPVPIVPPHKITMPMFPWGTWDRGSGSTCPGEDVSADLSASAKPD